MRLFGSTASAATVVTTALTLLCSSPAVAQTWTNCNPLKASCPDDPALGTSIKADFRKGAANAFTSAGGNPTYGSDGVKFTVSKSGESPQLISLFYIMFGRVEVRLKAAPGVGMVSSLVFQSDDLDEIDIEWLGADNRRMQSNYFGKGAASGYNRAEFNAVADPQGSFHTYSIDWTSERIVWAVDGTAVREVRAAQAGDAYPQTPMTVRFGAWAGGDASNAPGTIEWAGGPIDYSKGPFSMIVGEVSVTDYSTGRAYRYGDMSGRWQSIVAVDGKINGNINASGKLSRPTATAPAAADGGPRPSVPVGGIGKPDATRTPSGWPWDRSAPQPTGGAPDGWAFTPDGKVVPAGRATSSSAIATCTANWLVAGAAGSALIIWRLMW